MEPNQRDAPTIRRTRVEFSNAGSTGSDHSDRPLAFREEPLVEDASYARVERPTPHSEEVQRVHVEDEDRLAFRVGVNILTLVLIGIAGYLVWRNFFQ